MSLEIVMPQMGESITEGTVSKWLKQVGERIEKDEEILEISTDKGDAEVPKCHGDSQGCHGASVPRRQGA